MERLKVAVVGVGKFGSIHAKVYSQLKNAELVYVADSNPRQAKKIARKYHVNFATDYRELFGKVDAVSIATPSELHYKVASDFLKANIHTLIEKPMTQNLREAEELLKLAKENNLVLQAGHIERFSPAFKTIKEIANDPKFIECLRLGPFTNYLNRTIDTGVVLDLMIHDIDIILDLIKSPVKRVDAVGVDLLTQHEDIANARITFSNNAVANITASRVSRETTRKIRIFQKDTYISLDHTAQTAQIYRKKGKKILRERLNIKKEEPLKNELDSFINCILTKGRPLVSGEEAREALAVAFQILEKIKEQTPTE